MSTISHWNIFIYLLTNYVGLCLTNCVPPGSPQTCEKGWSPWTQCYSTGNPQMDSAYLKTQLQMINCRLPFAYFATTLESKMMQERRILSEYMESKGISSVLKGSPRIEIQIPGCTGFVTPDSYSTSEWSVERLNKIYDIIVMKLETLQKNMKDYEIKTAESVMSGQSEVGVNSTAHGKGSSSSSGQITVVIGPDGKPIVNVIGQATGDHTSVAFNPNNLTTTPLKPQLPCALLKKMLKHFSSSDNAHKWLMNATTNSIQTMLNGSVGNSTNGVRTPAGNVISYSHMCGFCYRQFRACRDPYMSWLDQKIESEVCDESYRVCTVPPLTDNTCNYNHYMPKQNKPYTSGDNEHLSRKLHQKLETKWMNVFGTNQSKMNCVRNEGLCHCCCGAYAPVMDDRGLPICRKLIEGPVLYSPIISVNYTDPLPASSLIVPDFPTCQGDFSSFSSCSPVGSTIQAISEYFEQLTSLGCKALPPLEVAIAITKAQGVSHLLEQVGPINSQINSSAQCGFCSTKISCCKDGPDWWTNAVKSELCVEHKQPCILPKLPTGCDYAKLYPSADTIARNFNGTDKQKSRIVGIFLQNLGGRRDKKMSCISADKQCYCCCNDHLPQFYAGKWACMYTPPIKPLRSEIPCSDRELWIGCSNGCEATCDAPESQCDTIRDTCTEDLAGCYCKQDFVRYGGSCLSLLECPTSVEPMLPTCPSENWTEWSMCEPVDASFLDPLSLSNQYSKHLSDIGCSVSIPSDVRVLFNTIPVERTQSRNKRQLELAHGRCGFCSTKLRCCKKTTDWATQATEKSICTGKDYSRPCVLRVENDNYSDNVCQDLHHKIFFNYANHFQQAVVSDLTLKAQILGKLSILNSPIKSSSFNCIRKDNECHCCCHSFVPLLKGKAVICEQNF